MGGAASIRPFLPAAGLLLLASLALAGNAAADTAVPGQTLANDTLWDLAGSPYTIDGDILVPTGVTLTIEAGVEVGWNLTYILVVEGGLIINGTNAAPVSLYATGMSFYPHWDGIRFNGHTIDSLIRNASFDRATIAVDVQDPRASLLMEDVFVSSISGYGDWGLRVERARSNLAVHRYDVNSIAQGFTIGNSSGLDLADLSESNLGMTLGVGLSVYNVSDTVIDGLDFRTVPVRLERVSNLTLARADVATSSGLESLRISYSSGVTLAGGHLQDPSGTRLRFHQVDGLDVSDLNATGGAAVWGNNSTAVSIARLSGSAQRGLRMQGISGLVLSNLSGSFNWAVDLADCPAFVLDGANFTSALVAVSLAGDTDGGRVSNATLTVAFGSAFELDDPLGHPDLDVSRGNTLNGWRIYGAYRQAGLTVANASDAAWVYVFDSPNVTIKGAHMDGRPPSYPAAVWVDSPGGWIEDWTASTAGPQPGLIIANSSGTTVEGVRSTADAYALWASGNDWLRVANSTFLAVSPFGPWPAVLIEAGSDIDLSNIVAANAGGVGSVTVLADRVRVNGLSSGGGPYIAWGLTFEGDDLRVWDSDFCRDGGLTLDHATNVSASNLTFCSRLGPGVRLNASSAVTLQNSTFDGLSVGVDVAGGSSGTFRWNNFARCNVTGLRLEADAGPGTVVYENTFACGARSAWDGSSAAATWYNATTRRGNMWDSYTGVDADHDGIGDTPFDIPGGNKQDLYPLVPVDTVPPVARPRGPLTVDEDVPVTLDGSNSTDDRGIVAAWWIIDLPGGPVNVSGLTANFTFGTPGLYTVTLFVSDSYAVSNASTTVTVRDVTAPTVSASTTDITGDEDTPLPLAVTAADNDPAFPAGATYTWSLTGPEAREWTSFGPSTEVTLAAPGTYTVVAAVGDAAGNVGTITLTLHVRDVTAPTCSGSGSVAGGSFGTITLQVSYQPDNDPAFPGPGAFRWTVTLPDGPVRTGTGTPFVMAAEGQGAYTVSFTCADPSGNQASGTFTVTVPDTVPPVWVPPGQQVVLDGRQLTLSAENATDASGVSGASWYDGSTAIGTGLSISPVWTGLGYHSVRVQIADGAGNTANFTLVVRVVDGTPPTLLNASLTERRQVTLGDVLTIDAAGAFQDNDPLFPGSPPLVWATSAPFEGWVVGAGNQSVWVVFAQAGNWTVRVTVTDPSGNAATFDVPVTVVAASPPGTTEEPFPIEILVLALVAAAAAIAGGALWLARRGRK